MSNETERETSPAPDADVAGVLANLPRTRPQRTSARRAAARDGAAARKLPTAHPGQHGQAAGAARGTANKAKTARKPKAAADSRTRAQRSSAPRSRPKAKTPRARTEQARAPRQGFESEAGSARGPVLPPGRTELLTAATELVADVARSTVERGASTLKGIVGRLRLP